MTASDSTAAARLRVAVAERALSPEPDATLRDAVETLQVATGDTLEAVIFFGSRRTRAANANAFSAYDLVLVVSAYRAFYEALARAGLTGKSPRLLSALSRWLPPTQVSLRLPSLHAKLAVLSATAFERETSPRRHDHFTIGRLFQPARVLFARTPAAREMAVRAVVAAHFETWRWSRPWLPQTFDAEAYGLRILEVSLGWEIRPEPAGRAGALWNAQRDEQEPVFRALLEDLERSGELRRVAGTDAPWRWQPVRLPGTAERLRLRFYFTRSIARATLRWAKHVLSFEGWLDYIVHKASRHTGEPIELLPHERRWPLVFLWGRVLRYLWQKNRKKGAAR